jgi:hypothetical protein
MSIGVVTKCPLLALGDMLSPVVQIAIILGAKRSCSENDDRPAAG